MKRISIFSVIIGFLFCWLAAPNVLAYDNMVSPERGMTAGISLGLSDSDHSHSVGIIVRPNIGYRFSRTWETGAFFRYEDCRGLDVYNLSLYGEYDFFPFRNDNFSLFVDLQAGLGWIPLDYDAEMGAKEPNTTFVEIGFVPGVKYHIPGTKANIRLRYLFVGFNNYKGGYNNHRACIDNGDFLLDASLRRLEIGISVNF